MFDDEAPQQSSELPPASIAGGSQMAPKHDEVPDIFDGSGGSMDEHVPDASPETTILGPSALESGKLQSSGTAANRPSSVVACAS